jgi:hypothetical protein
MSGLSKALIDFGIGKIRDIFRSARGALWFSGSAQEFVGRAGIAELGLNSQFADG